MKMYCINHVFTEFLNSACENSATAASSMENRVESNTYRKKYKVEKSVKLLQHLKYKLWLPEESRFLK